jgi:hypothetical protein
MRLPALASYMMASVADAGLGILANCCRLALPRTWEQSSNRGAKAETACEDRVALT